MRSRMLRARKKAGVVATLIGAYSDPANLTSYTFSVAWTGGTSDVIVLSPQGEISSAGIGSISSVTFDGVTISPQVSSGEFYTPCGVYALTGKSAGTYSCTVTYSQPVSRSALAAWKVVGASATAKDTGTATSGVGPGLSTSVDVLVGEVVISGCIAGESGTITWTGAIGDYNISMESNAQMSGATTVSTSSNRIGHSISADSSYNPTRIALVAAVFGP